MNSRNFILTFDDGPSIYTPRLLDTLEKHNIKVFFFVLGCCLKSKRAVELVKRAYSDGHIIGNHSYGHKKLNLLNREEIYIEIHSTHNLICDIIGECKYFRPPYRVINNEVNEVVAELGYKTLLWNVDSMDWKYKENGRWINHSMSQIDRLNSCTILMHDIHKTTVDHVDEFIKRIKHTEEYTFNIY